MFIPVFLFPKNHKVGMEPSNFLGLINLISYSARIMINDRGNSHVQSTWGYSSY